MASGRENIQEILSSSDDEIEYEPQTKRKRIMLPAHTAGPSNSAIRDVENIAPSAEVNRLENKLKAFAKDITKAFPYTKYGSSRDAFCYRRVRGHLAVFKRECMGQGKEFVDQKQWDNVINFVIMAWPFVDQLPRWDDPKHNKINEQCYKKLTSYLTNSLKKGKFGKNELQIFIGKFKKLANNSSGDNGMLSSIKVAEAALMKIK